VTHIHWKVQASDAHSSRDYWGQLLHVVLEIQCLIVKSFCESFNVFPFYARFFNQHWKFGISQAHSRTRLPSALRGNSLSLNAAAENIVSSGKMNTIQCHVAFLQIWHRLYKYHNLLKTAGPPRIKCRRGPATRILSVRPSFHFVCLSNACIVMKCKKDLSRFFTPYER